MALKNTRQLAFHIMKVKGLDTGDKVLTKAISYRLIHALRIQARAGKIVAAGRDKAAEVGGCERINVRRGLRQVIA